MPKRRGKSAISDLGKIVVCILGTQASILFIVAIMMK